MSYVSWNDKMAGEEDLWIHVVVLWVVILCSNVVE